MPEYPDIAVYLDALRSRLAGSRLRAVVLHNPFLLRTVEPQPDAFIGRRAGTFERMGKRIVLGFEGDLWMVLHLMIAGRLHWKPANSKPPGRGALMVLEFDAGFVSLTEAGSKRRASLHLVAGRAGLQALDPGGLEVLEADLASFAGRLRAENHTLKRALTDPRILSGIGNAYSDEILHRARLSPLAMSRKLGDAEMARLYQATRDTLTHWAERLGGRYGDRFPEKVTAFREGMAVHGRYRQPCPECGTPVQRIQYASNETNYCPRCQTGGRIYADRALSRLLKQDWPRRVEDLES